MSGIVFSFIVVLLGLCLCHTASSGVTCSMTTSCVHCKVFKGGDFSPAQCAKLCGDFVYNLVPAPNGMQGELCQFRDQNWCYYEYTIDDSTLPPVLNVNTDIVCLGRK